ncbi:MAG: hypothetical protein WC211_10125, partial [Dehalococcoidia bacterium]
MANWQGSAFDRRAVLRGGALGALGVAGAALLGCSGSGSKSGESGGAPSGGAAAGGAGGNGAPKNIKRADGFDPKFGQVPVNDRKVVKGGSFRRQSTDTSRENDPEVSIALADWEYVADRLAYANGFTMKITPDLLASYEWVDKLNLVLKLRPGIKTHNVA